MTMTRSVCQCPVRLGPSFPGGFYTKTESDAFFDRIGENLIAAIEDAKSRPPLKMGEFTIGRGGRIIEKSKQNDLPRPLPPTP